jgi:hypothetical protein
MASKEQLKTFLLDYLRRAPQTQFESVLQQGIEPKVGRALTSTEVHVVLQLIHELIASHVLMPGIDRGNSKWPWLSVTDHGCEVLKGTGAPVYDYDGYLKDLRSRVKGLDEIVDCYLRESLRAYQSNLYLASMVMLACASERAILLLIDTYVSSIADATNRQKLESRVKKRDISVAYENFKASFDSTKGQLGTALAAHDFDMHVDSIFTFIRVLRNSVVHAKGLPQLTTAVVYANLQQFSYYVEAVFALIEHYSSHSTTV